MNWAERVEAWRRDRMRFRVEMLRLPDGRSYGASLEPWQRADFEALDQREKYPNASMWRPRGHSKTSDVAAEAVCELFLGGPNARLYCAAVDRDQARLLAELSAGYILRNPALRELAVIEKWEIEVPALNNRLTVLASDVASSYGLLPSWVAVDEIAEWPDRRLFDALFSAMGKVPGARFITISTAGVIGHWSEEIYKLAQTAPGWYFSSRGSCASWVTPEFLDSQARILPPETYRRLHHNQWVSTSGSALTEEEIQRIFDPSWERQLEGRPGVGYAVGLDLGLMGDRSVRVVAHREGNRLVVDSIRTWQGSPTQRVVLADIEEDLIQVDRAFHRPTILCDFWQAAALVERLQQAGLRIRDERFTTAFRARLDGTLLPLIRDGLLRCYPHSELLDELRRLQVVQTRTGWRLDHPEGSHDDHVVALGLAVLELLENPPSPPLPRSVALAFQRASFYGDLPGIEDWATRQDAELLNPRRRLSYLDEADDPSTLIPRFRVGPGGVVTT